MEEADIEAARPSEGVPGSGETGETAAAAAELTYMDLKRKAIALGVMKHQIPADKDELMAMVMVKTAAAAVAAAEPEPEPARDEGSSTQRHHRRHDEQRRAP